MLIAWTVCAALVITCFWLHFTALKWIYFSVQKEVLLFRRPLLVAILGAFVAHILEVLMFAGGYFILEHSAGAGSLAGAIHDSGPHFPDYFYFSLASYSTLGFGDVVPQGPLRIVAGVEALVGLVLVAWTASFSFLMTERLWGYFEAVPTRDDRE